MSPFESDTTGDKSQFLGTVGKFINRDNPVLTRIAAIAPSSNPKRFPQPELLPSAL